MPLLWFCHVAAHMYLTSYDPNKLPYWLTHLGWLWFGGYTVYLREVNIARFLLSFVILVTSTSKTVTNFLTQNSYKILPYLADITELCYFFLNVCFHFVELS